MLFTIMEDMELQERCLNAGQEYFEHFYKGFTDVQFRAQILNAVAAGYSKGFRDAEKASLKEKQNGNTGEQGAPTST